MVELDPYPIAKALFEVFESDNDINKMLAVLEMAGKGWTR